MKLKTLKDLNLCEIYCKQGERCINKVLKQEAIKWVNEVDGRKWNADEWIREFFNITEEELK
ncbi:hypothetical protein LCGC14_0953820 [marine sediment metagenome]|uniref:Uncharacterized protein n=1 Tax=marine sediment metagenome TaxID=412755 RepID=A0A0F9P2I7_9ZZZZ